MLQGLFSSSLCLYKSFMYLKFDLTSIVRISSWMFCKILLLSVQRRSKWKDNIETNDCVAGRRRNRAFIFSDKKSPHFLNELFIHQFIVALFANCFPKRNAKAVHVQFALLMFQTPFPLYVYYISFGLYCRIYRHGDAGREASDVMKYTRQVSCLHDENTKQMLPQKYTAWLHV
jgi:hypothetical protein